ncbi:hypothetical protein Hanom_Chr05g00433351 [Helianthus anomalus]
MMKLVTTLDHTIGHVSFIKQLLSQPVQNFKYSIPLLLTRRKQIRSIHQLDPTITCFLFQHLFLHNFPNFHYLIPLSRFRINIRQRNMRRNIIRINTKYFLRRIFPQFEIFVLFTPR